MSMNHFSSDLPQDFWWTPPPPLPMMLQTPETSPSKNKGFLSQHHPATTTTTAFNLNYEEDEEDNEQLTDKRETQTKEEQQHQYQLHEIPKEPMFEKPLTPSDVGKLNRLVIPKQQAVKFFPLNGVDSGGDKGSLLSFEDESGKIWSFRYSYWNSSQSYVLTKGWSRFVKEKRLDAGDIVVFERHRVEGNRIFIGLRRRSSGVVQAVSLVTAAGGGGGWARVLYCGEPYRIEPNWPYLTYQPEYLHAGSVMQNNQTVNSKKLRLFGVNLECQANDSGLPTPPDDDDDDGGGSSMSSHRGEAHCHQYYKF